MKIKIIKSGSSGNCYSVFDGETKILIECGITIKEIKKALDFKLSDISGCIVSHIHKDHSKAMPDLTKAGIDCYASIETIEDMLLSGHRIHQLSPMNTFCIGTYTIMPFDTQHDCAGSCGFLIQSKNGKKLVFATDTFYIKYIFNSINIWMIECNYSKELLYKNIESGIISPAIKNRILKSHFSLDNVKKFFQANDMSMCEQIYLLHLSRDNSDVKLFETEIKKITGKPVKAC